MIYGEKHNCADIGMWMLQPPELYCAQGFPDGVRLFGTNMAHNVDQALAA